MTERRLAEIASYQDLITGLRQRVAELGTSFEAVGELTLSAPRYVGKILAPSPRKFLSARSFQDFLSALGVKLLLVEDEEQLARIRDRLEERSALGTRIESAVTITLSRRHFQTIGRKGVGASKFRGKRHYSRIAKAGGIARMQSLTREQRRNLSRRAHEVRWAARRSAVAAGIASAAQTSMVRA
jgi:hypothetical protein